MPGGYMGKILFVDLTKGNITEESVLRMFAVTLLAVSGWGLRFSMSA